MIIYVLKVLQLHDAYADETFAKKLLFYTIIPWGTSFLIFTFAMMVENENVLLSEIR